MTRILAAAIHGIAATGMDGTHQVAGHLLLSLSDAATMSGSALARERVFSKEAS